MDSYRIIRVSILGLFFAYAIVTECCTDFVFIIDGSADLQPKFKRIIDIAKEVASKLQIDEKPNRVAILEFGSQVRATRWIRYNFGELTTQETLENAIDKLPSLQGVSDKGKAYRVVVNEFVPERRDNASLVILMISDGRFRSKNERRTVNELVGNLASLRDVYLFAATPINDHNLPGMSNFTNGDETRVAAGSDAAKQSYSMLKPFIKCQQPILTTTSNEKPLSTTVYNHVTTESPKETEPAESNSKLLQTTLAEQSSTAKENITIPTTTLFASLIIENPSTSKPDVKLQPKKVKDPAQHPTFKIRHMIPPKLTRKLAIQYSTDKPDTKSLKKSLEITPLHRALHGVRTKLGSFVVPKLDSPDCQTDIIFLMDFSGGVGNKRSSYVDLASSLVKELDLGPNSAQVGMVRYSGPGRTDTVFHLNKHTSSANAIREMNSAGHMGGTTRTGEAILYTVEEFAPKYGGRKSARKIMIVFTDGYSQDDPFNAAEMARKNGIELYAIAIEDDDVPPNRSQLNDIAGNKKAVYISNEFDRLRSQIVNQLRKCAKY